MVLNFNKWSKLDKNLYLDRDIQIYISESSQSTPDLRAFTTSDRSFNYIIFDLKPN